MRNKSNRVRRIQAMRCGRQSFFHRTFYAPGTLVATWFGILLEIGEKFLARSLWNFLPLRPDGIESLACISFIGRRCADEVAIVHEDHALHRLRYLGIIRSQRCPKGWWTKHLAVKHSRPPKIWSVLVFAGDERASVLLRNRFPRNRPLNRGSDGIFRR